MDKPPGLVHQLAFALGILGFSWIGMMALHELGHVLGGLATGGTVQRVVIPVFGFSRTDVQPNPSPGVTVWAGPIVGVVLPLVMWLAVLRLPRPISAAGEKPLRFFAGFCLVANGAYLSLGTFDRVGDVGEMLDTGTPRWVLWVFGALTIPAGLWMWHGLGERLGLSSLRSKALAWGLFAATGALLFVDIEIMLVD